MGSVTPRASSNITAAEAALPGNGITSKPDAPNGAASALFTPLKIGNGTLTLSHRVVLAPLTRNRGIPLKPEATPDDPNRIWYPDALVTEHYVQRATPGGLLITEGLPPSLECNGMPGVPGLWLPEQVAGWKAVVDAVHAKNGFIYAQLWNAGRASIPQHTGMPTVSASATPYEDGECYPYPPPGTSSQVKYEDFPPTELSIEGIKKQIADYVNAAKLAVMECGFDGVEVHGGNGYLPEQFLSSNINKRTDAYGGSPEKRCTFLLELMEALASEIGENKLAIRLSPFGMYNQARGTQRLETWGHLCRELKKKHKLSYVHFIEPRYEQVHSLEEKNKCEVPFTRARDSNVG
jgi:2,4-dienoyl-CoA reductase-like NADH-dependent reductase (Old Yellow Enzyme family)